MDLPDEAVFKRMVKKFVNDALPKACEDVDRLLTKNRIFVDRTKGIGALTKEEATAWSITGPMARASGVQPHVSAGRVYVNSKVAEKLLWADQQGLLRVTAEQLQQGGSTDVNDAFVQEGDRVRTVTNRSGGVQGGISNGEDIVFRVAFKPTATISQKQQTVSVSGEAAEIKARGRHDPCVLPRAVPMVEAMTRLVLVDHWLRQRAVSGS